MTRRIEKMSLMGADEGSLIDCTSVVTDVIPQSKRRAVAFGARMSGAARRSSRGMYHH